MNKPTLSLKKKPVAATPKETKKSRPATKQKKDRAPKSWEECLQKWRGGEKLPAQTQCVVYQLVAMAYSHKRPELLDMIPEEWQEAAEERYADLQFKHQK